jgi:hypothetical protein
MLRSDRLIPSLCAAALGIVSFERNFAAVEFVRLCYYAIVRTTLDISDEAYYIAKAIARDQNRSLGRVVGDLILQSSKGAKSASIKMSDYGFPTFHCARPVTSEDVKALDDEA